MSEVDDTLQDLITVMRPILEDGLNKRHAGQTWKHDPDHVNAMHRHLHRYDMGELVDEHSRRHPLAHAGVRALMQAYQEERELALAMQGTMTPDGRAEDRTPV